MINKIMTHRIENEKTVFEILTTNKDNTYKFIDVIVLDLKPLDYQQFLRLENRNTVEFIGLQKTEIDNTYTAIDFRWFDDEV